MNLRKLLAIGLLIGSILGGIFVYASPAHAISGGDILPGSTDSSVSTCAYENLGWVICPVLRATATAGDYAFTFVTQDFMQVEIGLLDSGSGAMQAGAVVRNIANVLFVVVMLVIIYSLITNQGMSNYNLKRTAPRFIVAVILVQASFLVCQLAVDISNIAGVSAQQILVDNIAKNIGNSAMPVSSEIGNSETETLSTITSSVVSKNDLSWPLLAPLTAVVMSVAVICSILIIILIVRKTLVVALVLLSPLAFVAYLLPNTSDYFTKWLRMFISTLVLFPVVAVLIGTGQIVSASIIKAGSNSYKVKNDSVSVTKSSNGSATLYLVAAAAAVMPLVGTWYAFKVAMNAFDSAGARISQRGLRRSSRERDEDVKKREQATMDMNKKSMMLRGINRLQQLNVAKDGESTASIFARAGSYRGRGKHQTKSVEQAKFDDQVQQRLNELRGSGSASPQELYSQALQRYQDKLGDAGDNGLNINSYEGIELKASEAYLLESLAKGMSTSGGVGAVVAAGGGSAGGGNGQQQGKDKQPDEKEKKSAGLSSLDRNGKSKGGNGGGDGQSQQDSYRPPATAGGVPSNISQGATVIVQQVQAPGDGGAAGGGANQMAGGGTGFAQRRPAQTSNELLAKARAAKYAADAQDSLDVGDELLELASREAPNNDTPQDK